MAQIVDQDLKDRFLKTLYNFLASKKLPQPKVINDTDRLSADLRLDSLHLVELGMKIEDNFGVSIPDESAIYEPECTVENAFTDVEQRVLGF